MIFTAYNTEILKLNAKDKDLGENSEMVYELLNDEDKIFFIDNKGVLRVKKVSLLQKNIYLILYRWFRLIILLIYEL